MADKTQPRQRERCAPGRGVGTHAGQALFGRPFHKFGPWPRRLIVTSASLGEAGETTRDQDLTGTGPVRYSASLSV